jgi:hypothetical protein
MLQINKSSPRSNDEPVWHVVAHGMRIRKTGSCRRRIEVKELMALSRPNATCCLDCYCGYANDRKFHRFLRLCR